jgi:hypothetical protein
MTEDEWLSWIGISDKMLEFCRIWLTNWRRRVAKRQPFSATAAKEKHKSEGVGSSIWFRRKVSCGHGAANGV